MQFSKRKIIFALAGVILTVFYGTLICGLYFIIKSVQSPTTMSDIATTEVTLAHQLSNFANTRTSTASTTQSPNTSKKSLTNSRTNAAADFSPAFSVTENRTVAVTIFDNGVTQTTGRLTTSKTTMGPERDAIVIISMDRWRQPENPVLFDKSGHLTELNRFRFRQNTGAIRSCSLIHDGVMYIVGGKLGSNYDKQISILESCQLRQVGQMPISFEYGACNTYTNSTGKEQALLCFSSSNSNGCFRYARLRTIYK